jgi:hypothetical protein
MMTNAHAQQKLVPRSQLALNPPDLWVFMCFTRLRARLHAPRISLLSDALFSERLARQGPSS